MTVTNDQGLFAEITRRENALAVKELRTEGWRSALAGSQHRFNAMAKLIASSASPGLACKTGCSYCCYYRVEARPEEILQMIAYITKTFSTDQLQTLRAQVDDNVATLSGKSPQEQAQANLPCPLLRDGACSVYEVRPARCRTFHATDVTGCRQSWEEPQNLTIKNSFIPELYHFGEAHLSGFRRAMTDAGYDSRAYELNAALRSALTDATPRRRFDKHKRAFVGVDQ